MTHEHAVVEAILLAHKRLGVAAVRAIGAGLLPLVSIDQVDPVPRHRAMSDLLANASWSVSFVDRVSFASMRRHAIDTAFTLERAFATASTLGRAFATEGFRVVPA